MRRIPLIFAICFAVISCADSNLNEQQKNTIGLWVSSGNMDDILNYACVFSNGFIYIETTQLADYQDKAIDTIFGEYTIDHIKIYGYTDNDKNIVVLEKPIQLDQNVLGRNEFLNKNNRQLKAFLQPIVKAYHIQNSPIMDLRLHVFGYGNLAKVEDIPSYISKNNIFTKFANLSYYNINMPFPELIIDKNLIYKLIYK